MWKNGYERCGGGRRSGWHHVWCRVVCSVGCSGSGWDISSAGVVPLRHIPDVIVLVGRREGAAESRVLQGVRSVRLWSQIVVAWTRTFTTLR